VQDPEVSKDIGPRDLTPSVSRVLEIMTEREERLSFLTHRGPLSRIRGWQRWVDAALPTSPPPQLVRDRKLTLCPEEEGPIVDRLMSTMALVDQAIDEREHPSMRLLAIQNARRARRLAAKVVRRCRTRYDAGA
jgi:hypothetical protein